MKSCLQVLKSQPPKNSVQHLFKQWWGREYNYLETQACCLKEKQKTDTKNLIKMFQCYDLHSIHQLIPNNILVGVMSDSLATKTNIR